MTTVPTQVVVVVGVVVVVVVGVVVVVVGIDVVVDVVSSYSHFPEHLSPPELVPVTHSMSP